jgi:hypothetical protein
MAIDLLKTFFNERSGKTEFIRPFEFKNKTVEKDFLNLMDEAIEFSGASGKMPERLKVNNIAKKYGIGLSTLESFLSQLRAQGVVAERGASIPIEVVRLFYPEILDKKGNVSKEKWLDIPYAERRLITGKAIVDNVNKALQKGGLLDVRKTQANEIKNFLDKFIEFEKKGLGSRLFLGNSPFRWVKTDIAGGSNAVEELYREIAKARTFKRNLKDSSSFQFIKEFNDPKYKKAIQTILNKYLEPTLSSKATSGDYRVKNKPALRAKLINDIFKKDLKDILKSKEFSKVKDIEEALALVRKKFSDPLIYPNLSSGKGSELFNVSFDPIKYGQSTTGFLKKDKPYNIISNAFLKTPSGKLAIKELGEYADNQRAIGRINVFDPNARALIDEKYANYRNAITNPRLSVFFKPLREMGIISEKTSDELRRTGEAPKRFQTGNVFDRITDFNSISKVVPSSSAAFFSNEVAKAKQEIYQKKYQAAVAKIADLPKKFQKNPRAYQNAVVNLNKVLSAQLGGLELAGEHRLGISLLDKKFNPNYVARIVLGSNAFNNMKNQFIESQVASTFNNPRISPQARADVYNNAANRFVKEFELPTSISRTLPKFDVKKGRLIETQLERNVGRLGIDGLGNLKATVKNALIEQALVDRKFPGVREGKAADFILQSKRAGIKNAPLVSKILNTIDKEGPGSAKIDKLVNNLVEGEFEKTVNAESMKQFGRRFCKDGCLAVTVDQDPVIARKGLQQTIGKFATGLKTFATSPGVKRFTLAGAAGAGVQAIVKEFRNDDPTSYLSNEDQQKNMLVSMAMDPIAPDFERPDILDFQLPAVGASIAGATAISAPSTIKASRSRGLGVEQKGMIRTAGRVLGRGLGVAASPGLLAPLAAMDITSQIAEGDSAADIATDPLNYLYPAFADQTPKLTRGLPSAVRGIASLGMSPGALRVLSRAGILGFGASLGLQGMKLLQDD